MASAAFTAFDGGFRGVRDTVEKCVAVAIRAFRMFKQ